MLWRKGFWLLGVLGGFRGGILRLVQLQGLLTVGFVCSYHGRFPSWSWGACSFCCSRFRGVVVLKAFYLEVLLMAKTVASIEAQIAALMAEKKELEIAERKADKDALGVAESIIGKIVLRIVDADWKRIDPALLEGWLDERSDKIREAVLSDELERADALRRIKKFK